MNEGVSEKTAASTFVLTLKCIIFFAVILQLSKLEECAEECEEDEANQVTDRVVEYLATLRAHRLLDLTLIKLRWEVAEIQ